MLVVAVHRDHRLSASLTFIGLAAAFGSLWTAAPVAPLQVTPLLMLDRYALFYIGLIVAASMAFVLLSYGYFERCEGDLAGIGWVIAGGESGPGSRAPEADWFRDIRDRCQASQVPFFFKQWEEER